MSRDVLSELLPFVSLLVLLIDGMIGSGVVEAVRSESFEPAPGIDTKSEIRPGRKGTVRFNLEYEYTVNGQQPADAAALLNRLSERLSLSDVSQGAV